MKDPQTSYTTLFLVGRIIRFLILLMMTFLAYMSVTFVWRGEVSATHSVFVGIIAWFSVGLAAATISLWRQLSEPWRLIQDSILVVVGCFVVWAVGINLLWSGDPKGLLAFLLPSVFQVMSLLIGDARLLTPISVVGGWMLIVSLTVLCTRSRWWRNESPLNSAVGAVIKGGWVFASGMFGIVVATFAVVNFLPLQSRFVPVGPFMAIAVVSGLGVFLFGLRVSRRMEQLKEKSLFDSFLPFSIVVSAGKRSVTLGKPLDADRDPHGDD